MLYKFVMLFVKLVILIYFYRIFHMNSTFRYVLYVFDAFITL